MKKTKNYKLLAADLDGTLLTNDKNIGERTLTSLRKAIEGGMIFAIATGRAWPGVRRYAVQIPVNGPVITIDGSMIVDPVSEKILYSQPLEYEDAVRLLNMGVERSVTQVIWCRNRLYGTILNDRMEDYSKRFAGGMEVLKAEYFEQLAKDGISKVLWYDTPDNVTGWVEQLRAASFESLTACTSEPYFVEIFNAKVSKAKALEQISSMYNIQPDEMIAVGDGGNDVPMLHYAGLGIAMGNASDTVKKEADAVTSDNSHDAIADVLSEYVFGGING